MWHLTQNLLFPYCVMPMLSCLLFWLPSEQRTFPILCNLTIGLHSSRGLVSQDLSLLSESKEKELVSDRFYYIFYSNRFAAVNQSITLSFSSLFTIYCDVEKCNGLNGSPCNNPFAILPLSNFQSRYKVEKIRKYWRTPVICTLWI